MTAYALISVWDKTGLEPFARALVQRGIRILSTGGTAKFLEDLKIEYTPVSTYTGQPEILDGRVKTLHPKIHGGILARRDREDDLAELKKSNISPIDFVIVNLYPFSKKVEEIEANGGKSHESLIESIDIGGPTMIRAAAKNCHHVVPVCDPVDYSTVLSELDAGGKVSLETRRKLASKVFAVMSAYDGAIARYFSLSEQLLGDDGQPVRQAPIESFVMTRAEELRYGENPHQSAGLYRRFNVPGTTANSEKTFWKQLQGKELSYNNLLDMQAAIDLYLDLHRLFPQDKTALVIKHSNPCGAAIGATIEEAFTRARACDPVSAFGGIIAVTGPLEETTAKTILEGFVEVVITDRVTPEASALFTKKKNVRLIECDFERLASTAKDGLQIRTFYNEFLLQGVDNTLAGLSEKSAVGARPNAQLLADARFAWALAKHVKSNAIIIAKNLQAIGVGAGQMSRVDSARLALSRAREHGHDPRGAVAASDAFLPFPDTLEILNDGGVVALVQPGGSVKDSEVIASANSREMVMLVTGERHFRH